MKHFILLMLFCLNAHLAHATSFDLNTTGQEPLYQTTLNLSVYQNSHHDDLEDLGIENSHGEQLPYALISYAAMHPPVRKQTSQALNVYPIFESNLGHSNELHIQLDKMEESTNLNISTNGNPNHLNIVYLVDAGAQHHPLQTFNVLWQGSPNKLISVEIYSSNDLNDWLKIGNAVLLSVDQTAEKTLQNTITLNTLTTARYLQIKTTEPLADDVFKLTGINAIFNSTQATTLPIIWQPLTFINREEDKKKNLTNLNFEALGHFPASHLRIHLPQENTITHVNVFARNNIDSPWRQVTNASLYRMSKNSEIITNSDLIINATTARYWQLQFDQTGGGIGEQNPTFSLGWLPQTIVWNARGKAPFILKTGEKTSHINKVSIANLMPDDRLTSIQKLPKATLKSNSESTIKNTWDNAPDYKRWGLWGILLLGVLLLARMAYSLLKSSRESQS